MFMVTSSNHSYSFIFRNGVLGCVSNVFCFYDLALTGEELFFFVYSLSLETQCTRYPQGTIEIGSGMEDQLREWNQSGSDAITVPISCIFRIAKFEVFFSSFVYICNT